jgi:hypothetical protein
MKLWTNLTPGIHQIDANHCHPFNTYVLPDELSQHPFDKDFLPCPHKIKPYYPGRSVGGATAVYRAGVIGDAIMATGIIRYLVEKSGGMVDVYAPARNLTLYGGLGARVLPLPPTAQAWDTYDAHVPLDDLFSGKVMGTELGTGPGNFFGRVYRWMGAETDEVAVDPIYKKPTLTVIDSDSAELVRLGKWPLPEPFFVYHVTASGPTRTYPPDLGREAVMALLEAFPTHHAVPVGASPSIDFRIPHKRVVDLFNCTKEFRSLLPVLQAASFVVCPDSAVLHAAAGVDTPTVSIWGAYAPSDRCEFYPKSYPLYVPEVCPHAPCHPQSGLPQAKCKDATNRTKGTQFFCNAIRAVTAQMIVEAAKKAVQ